MKSGNSVCREARDEMGRSDWVNVSLARTIRRDSKKHCTLVWFDKDHAIAVVDGVDVLIGGATPPTASRPRNFDELTCSRPGDPPFRPAGAGRTDRARREAQSRCITAHRRVGSSSGRSAAKVPDASAG